MNIRNLHSWDMDYTQAHVLQSELRKRVTIEDGSVRPRLIAGADVAYSPSTNTLFAAVVVLDISRNTTVETVFSTGVVDFPYIPGLLTFREGPVLLAAFRKLKIVPDVIIFDGQGIAHPRSLGIATHMGLCIEVPTIGCAKKCLVGKHDEVGPMVGDRSELWYENRIVGYVVRTRRNVKPVYISPGNRIGLDQSLKIVLQTTRGYRLPEPTRQAHITANQLRLHST